MGRRTPGYMTDSNDTEPLKAGDHFGDYVVERKLGSGAMGAVYLVHAPDGSLFAVKIMFPSKMTHDLRSRFAHEGDFAMKIRHRNLISVHDVGEDPETGLCYIIMDYVPGGTLSDRIKAQGRLSVGDAVLIIMQIAAALDVAHKNGIVHRDVKPDNILFAADGTPKLADLGAAKFNDDSRTMMTMTGAMIGTPAYMSPEQLMDSHHIDARADIYSLGVVLYEMLAGERPNRKSSAIECLAWAIKGKPLPDIREKRPEISAAVAHVLSLMYAPKPEDRPASTMKAAQLLHKAATGRMELPQNEQSSSGAMTDGYAAKRKRAIVVSLVVAGLVTFLVLGLVGIFYAGHRRYSEKPEPVKSTVSEEVNQPKSESPAVVTNVIEKISVVTNVVEKIAIVTNLIEREVAVEDVEEAPFAHTEEAADTNAAPTAIGAEARVTYSGLRQAKIGQYTWYYNIQSGEAVIWRGDSTYGNNTVPAVEPSDAEAVVVPQELDGYKVGCIGSFAFFRCPLKSVTIPEGVHCLRAGAFFGCRSLVKVSLPSTLDEIERDAFAGCTSLEELDIGNCSHVSGGSFNCPNLARVSVSPSNRAYRAKGGCLFTCDMRKLVSFPRTEASVVLPESVEEIGESAFRGCGRLESVSIPGTVKKIGACAFASCRNLASIGFLQGLREIEENAFAYCENLRSVTFPDSLLKIRSSIFSHCSSLRRVEFWGDAPQIDEPDRLFKDTPANLRVFVNRTSRGWTAPKTIGLPNQWPKDGAKFSRSILPMDGVARSRNRTARPQKREPSIISIVNSQGQPVDHDVVDQLVQTIDKSMGNMLRPGMRGRTLYILMGRRPSGVPKEQCFYFGEYRRYYTYALPNLALRLISESTGGAWGPDQTGDTPECPQIEGVLFQDIVDDAVQRALGDNARSYQPRRSAQRDLDFVLGLDPQMTQYDFYGKAIGKIAKPITTQERKALRSCIAQAKIKWAVNELSRAHDTIIADYFRARHEARMAGRLHEPVTLGDFVALMSIAAKEDRYGWFAAHGMKVSKTDTAVKLPDTFQAEVKQPESQSIAVLSVFPNADIKENNWKMRAAWRYTVKQPTGKQEWFAPEFNDKRWKQTKKPVGMGPNELVGISEKMKAGTMRIWMRRHFAWKPATVRKVVLNMVHGGRVTIYLNGVQIFERDGSNTWWQPFSISGDKFQKAVREGDNVLAVSVDSPSVMYFDCGLSVEVLNGK